MRIDMNIVRYWAGQYNEADLDLRKRGIRGQDARTPNIMGEDYAGIHIYPEPDRISVPTVTWSGV